MDAHYAYSKVVKIQMETKDVFIDILQNPVSANTLQLIFDSPEPCLATVEMYNAAGQKAGNEILDISSGKNLPAIDISYLAAGVYLAKVSCGSKTVVLKFIK